MKTNCWVALAAGAGALVAVGLLMVVLMLVEMQPAEATFPGQNGKIAYASSDILPYGSTTDTEIYTINPTGGTPFQLTNNERRDTEPSYSPDGQRIALSRWDGTDYEIYTVNSTGGGEFQVTNNDMQDYSPDYSPNGEKIAYTHCLIPYYQEEEERCGELFTGVDYTEIFTIKATGENPFRVTHNKTHDSAPSYSPNGNKIAYSHVAASDREIYKISATGGTPVNITHNDQDDLGPSYSPNGRKIAYYRWDENPDGSLNFEIYKIHHNGGAPVRVTNSDSRDFAPSWGSRP